MSADEPILRARGISKSFGAVRALREVDFTVARGEIHGLVGENGAGKSTLMKILSGVYRPDGGSIRLDGKAVQFENPKHAYDLGIRIVHQELSLVPSLTVSENLYLHEFASGYWTLIDRQRLAKRAADLLREWQLDISPTEKIENLPMGKRQLVEIAREIYKKGCLLILDEPTSSLSGREIEYLFKVLQRLKELDVSIVFISHRLDEVLQIADTVTILRNGKNVGGCPASELNLSQTISLMLGREMKDLFPKRRSSPGESLLVVRGLSGPGFADLSFELRTGEILGFAGLMGAGRSEVLRSLFGIHPVTKGTVTLNGREIQLHDPPDALRAGLALLSENRLDEGIFPDLSVSKNVVLMNLDELTSRGWLNAHQMKKAAEGLVKSLRIVTYDPQTQLSKQLSGGNQQKVILARLISANPRILLLDEPTRGVDVGTKAEIHQLICDWVSQGKAIIMVSSDISELVCMCDRILVLHQGALAGEFERHEFSEEKILHCATGMG